MKINLFSKFRNKLEKQVRYIARDKPEAAKNFKKNILGEIRQISDKPFAFRKSIYFKNENIRDLIFLGLCRDFSYKFQKEFH